MDRRSAIAKLPGSYGFALFLREEGLSDEEVAVRLGLDRTATENLLELAERKLAALMRPPGAEPNGGETAQTP